MATRQEVRANTERFIAEQEHLADLDRAVLDAAGLWEMYGPKDCPTVTKDVELKLREAVMARRKAQG